ncbi:hypothetical protein KIH23_02640 [Flavobacterium sp. CYK-55]|uniref:hypothetical protein n=1 Tax=Flavobacterium sp. CYK-55 TaxID=2835529 RepID=UPI001BCA8EDC|nr:hypothetical protein [Flavobacterium sp. CYK-55]MBS7786182.1 hypothetical protein [Flavobacterium sp. CYK-55]
MKFFVYILTTLLLAIACKNTPNDSVNYDSEEIEMSDIQTDDDAQQYYDQTGNYPDGTYCSEVEYYNPNTGTRNTYDLDVEVEDGELTVIHWPNGGWLDETHFYPEDITSGQCEFTSDRGYRYTITLGEFGGCGYTDDYKIRNDVNSEVESTTCPNCGDEKNSYDDYCDSCQKENEEEKE